MGKATTTTTTTMPTTTSTEMKKLKKKKKKGRPSLLDLQKRREANFITKNTLNNVNNSDFVPPQRRSTRRNPNSSPESEFSGDDDDDDDERKEKKVKLVVRLPPQQQQQSNRRRDFPASSSENDDVEDSGEDSDVEVKRRKIDDVDRRSNDVVNDQGEKLLKVTDTSNGSPLVSGPTTPLPDKKLLVFILDRLQKKDTYGVFSEPVDPDELPDYHEIIEQPMDFGTVRKKLDGGLYSNLEELEIDVFLICSNAMQYNAPDTVYYRQARSIQDLAKRDFENLRHEGEDGEPQPKVVRRGRPPSKNKKVEESSSPPPSRNPRMSVEGSPIDGIAPELSSGVAPTSGEEKANGSNPYNLRKAPMLYKFRSLDSSSTYRSRNGEASSEWSVDWNNEFPASILRADMKYGKKHFSVDENRRDTYQLSQASASCSEPLFWNANGDLKRLMAVGLHVEQYSYARSLARFAANLGPVVWRVASKKLKAVLPDGVKYGPGWVGDDGGSKQRSTFPSQNNPNNPSDSLASADHNSGGVITPSLPGMSSAVMSRPTDVIAELARTSNSQYELAKSNNGFTGASPASTSVGQQKAFINPRNGFNGMFGYDLSAQMEVARSSMSKGQPSSQDASRPGQGFGPVARRDTSSSHHSQANHVSSWSAMHSSSPAPRENLEFCTDQNARPSSDFDSRPPASLSSGQFRPSSLAIPPDLNVKVQTSGSPSSSSLQVGSPQQPDLALQL